eukprot:TRINITY_DN1054_c0_g2_i1.p1 TRINITY_DN1054_c0_g2~~TRINITY_DN1054_c0_g2_i1.p1  ORF type:complete len:313 (+),score=67.81 TRINITY_DN1054_c0_g2_i1:40-978(+)
MRFALGLVLFALSLSAIRAAYCSTRGGCSCDCSWTSAHPCSTSPDDGSCCYGCCCGGSTPTEPPTSSGGGGHGSYCPGAGDLTVAYGSAQLKDQGWSVNGGGAAATKAAFNLLGGSVEFDIDLSNVRTGVNANIYTISPPGMGSSAFDGSKYCDGARTDNTWCVEVDWIESNGNCGGATTLHTVEGPGNNGCTAWGCRNTYHYNGRSSFHMKIEYGTDGTWTTIRDGQVISPSDLSPGPTGNDWYVLQQQYSSRGAVIYSSLWTGWVPVDDCGTSGDLGSSGFSISNLVITGTVVQGPTPRACSNAVNTTIA